MSRNGGRASHCLSSVASYAREQLCFLDKEFRAQALEVFLAHCLTREERVAEYLCVPQAKFLGVEECSGRRRFVFYLISNPSKFREGDHLLLTPEKANSHGSEIRLHGIPLVWEEFIPSSQRLFMREPNTSSPRTKKLRRGLTYVLDKNIPQFFPTYSYSGWGLGMLCSGLPQSVYLQRMLKGDEFSFPKKAPPPVVELNPSQLEAYWSAFSHSPALIQGPPGTGKTYVIAALACGLARQNKRVLITGLTHKSIDNALMAIKKADAEARVFKVSSTLHSAELERFSIPLINTPPKRKVFWQGLLDISEPLIAGMTVYSAFRPFASGMLQNFRRIRHLRPSRPSVLSEQYWQKILDYVVALAKTSPLPSPESYFDVVIFDEASQLLFPQALLAMVHTPHLIFVGDPAQLGPIITSQGLADRTQSVFEYLLENHSESTKLLTTSYRMNQELLSFSSAQFYQGKLLAHQSVQQRTLPVSSKRYRELLHPQKPVVYAAVDHDGATKESKLEAILVANLALELMESGLNPAELAIISPYRRQNNLIKQMLESLQMARELEFQLSDLVVDTVERMQGQEREVILVSLTVSEEELLEQDLLFLYDSNRFNVLLTRAKSKFILVGSKKFFYFLPSSLKTPVAVSLSPFPLYLQSTPISERRQPQRSAIQQLNVIKQWYFERKQRGEVVSATRLAMQLLRDYEKTSLSSIPQR